MFLLISLDIFVINIFLSWILFYSNTRYILFYLENITFFLEKNFYVNLKLNNVFKKTKIKNTFWLIIYIINLILFLLFITLSYIYDKEPLEKKLITFIFIIIILITISFFIINVLLKTKKLKIKYNELKKLYSKNDYEKYFLNINSFDLKDKKFSIIDEYIKNKKMKILYIPLAWKFTIAFPNYKKLKILLNKISSFEEKILYINSILATEPLKLRIKKEYLDREQLSYLHYLIIDDIKKEGPVKFQYVD